MRINWVSPLPPRPSPVAAYTARLLPALTAAAEIRLWTEDTTAPPGGPAPHGDSPERPAASVPWDVRLFHADAPDWAELNRARVSVYHLADDPDAHCGAFRLASQAPGVVVLHDHQLARLVAAAHRAQGDDRAGYLERMDRAYGESGRRDAASFWDGFLTAAYMSATYPLTSELVDRSLGIVVHTREALETLAGRTSCPVTRLALPYRARFRSEPASSRPDRPSRPIRLVALGQPSPERLLGELLDVLAERPDSEVKLDLFGAAAETDHLKQRVRSLELADRVEVHTSAPDQEIDRALVEADLAVNLIRDPGAAATLVQLRIWEHSLPSLVSGTGWFAEQPPGTLLLLRPDHEAPDLRAALASFLRSPRRFREMGEAGRAHLEREHTPEAYVEVLLELCANGETLRPALAATEALLRADEEVLRLLPERRARRGRLNALPPRPADTATRAPDRGRVHAAAERALALWTGELEVTLRAVAQEVEGRLHVPPAEEAASGPQASSTPGSPLAERPPET